MKKIVSDTLLWDNFCAGDHESFSWIYNQHVQALYRYGLKLSTDQGFVMDCIHDLYVDLYKKKNIIEQPHNMRFYLIKSLKNKMQRSKTINNKFYHIEDSPFFLEPEIDEPFFAEDKEIDRKKRSILRKTLHKLPDRQKEVIYLRYINNLTNEEIAQIMNITHQAVRNTLHKAIENLRKTVSKEDFILFLAVLKI